MILKMIPVYWIREIRENSRNLLKMYSAHYLKPAKVIKVSECNNLNSSDIMGLNHSLSWVFFDSGIQGWAEYHEQPSKALQDRSSTKSS